MTEDSILLQLVDAVPNACFPAMNGAIKLSEEQTTELRGCQSVEAEAFNQLRNDQAKLLELQDRIAHLDKALEQLSTPGR